MVCAKLIFEIKIEKKVNIANAKLILRWVSSFCFSSRHYNL